MGRSRQCGLALLLALGSGFLAACSGGDSGDPGGGGGNTTATCEDGPDTGDLPCDVADVLSARCQGCHQDPPVGGAHFPLLSYEDTHKLRGMTGKRNWQRMAEVIEPDGSPHMPYKDAEQLSEAQLQTLRDWFAACAAPVSEGTGCDTE